MTGKASRISPALIWCPFPDRETALRISHRLLDDGLIACANVVPGMLSVFVWNGEREQTEETGALLKTNSAMLERAIGRLTELHLYDEPAILAWLCDASAPGTAAWLGALGK